MHSFLQSLGISIAQADSKERNSASQLNMLGLGLQENAAAARLNPIAPDQQKTSWLSSIIHELRDHPPLPEPNRFDDISSESREVLFMDSFDGARFDFSKMLLREPSMQKQFAYTHKLWLGSRMLRSGYHYGFDAIFVDTSGVLLTGGLDILGNVQGRYRQQYSMIGLPQVVTNLQFQVPEGPNPAVFILDGDYEGSDWNAQVKMMPGSFYQFQYMQSISKSLSIGCDFAHPIGQLSVLGTGFRYCDNRNFASMTYHSNGLAMLSYARKVNPQFSMSSDLKIETTSHESNWSLGLSYHPSNFTVIKASVDGTGKVASTCEEIVLDSFRLVFSSELDHAKTDYKFGFGITVG